MKRPRNNKNSIIASNRNDRNNHLLSITLLQSIVCKSINIPIPCNNIQDKITWKYHSNESFLVKGATWANNIESLHIIEQSRWTTCGSQSSFLRMEIIREKFYVRENLWRLGMGVTGITIFSIIVWKLLTLNYTLGF